jgi:hypothetical protein
MRSGLLSLAAASCLAVASSTQAADLYMFPTFVADGAGVTENPRVRGSAVFLYDDASGTTTVILAMRNLLPNTDYSIKFGAGDDSHADPYTFTADSHGRAAYAGQYGPTPNVANDPGFFQVFRWDGDFETLDEVTPAELRARGVFFGLP